MDEKEFEIESNRLMLDERRLDQDVRLKEKDIDVRLLELKRYSIKPGLLTVLIAVIGLIGTAIGAYIQGLNNNELQKRKHDTEIILKGLELKTSEKRKEYLHFVAKLGLLNNDKYSDKILKSAEFPQGPIQFSSGWSKNNRAHAVLWVALSSILNIEDVSFNDASQWSVSFLRQGAPGETREVTNNKSASLAQQLDVMFIDLFRAKYETETDKTKAVNQMSELISSNDKNISHLGELVDNLYIFGSK